MILQSEQGLHARPASIVVAEAKKFEADIKLMKDGNAYNAKSIMSIMSMEAKKGDEIDVVCEGADADVAKTKMIEVLTAL